MIDYSKELTLDELMADSPLSAGLANPQPQPTTIVDGDTIVQDGLTSRITGFDTMESIQGSKKSQKLESLFGISKEDQVKYGLQGKAVLEELMQDPQYSQFITTGNDVYGRPLINNQLLEQEMVRRGVATPTSRYDQKQNDLYRKAQLKKYNLGLTDEVDAYDAQRQYNVQEERPGLIDTLGQAVDALQSGTVQAAGKLGDFVTDLVGWGMDKVGAEGAAQYLDKAFETMASPQYADELTGYDRSEVDYRSKEALYEWKKGNYFTAILQGLAVAPQVMGESLPLMAEMVLGGGKVKAGLKGAEKLGSFLKANTGLTTVIAQETNKQAEDYETKHGEKVSGQKMAEMVAINTVMFSLDRLVFKDVLKAKDSLAIAASKIPEGTRFEIFKGVIRAGATTTSGGIKEFGQEYLQTMGEILNVNVKEAESYLDEIQKQSTQDESLSGAILGGGAGSLTSGIGQVANATVPALREKEKAKRLETLKQATTKKEVRETLAVKDWEKELDAQLLFLEEAGLSVQEIRDGDLAELVDKERTKAVEKYGKEVLGEFDLPTLRSEQEAIDTMEMIVENSPEKNDILRKNIETIASNHDIGPKEVDRIMQVEKEATTGERGYKTYGRIIRSLQSQEEPDQKKIAEYQGKLLSFYSNQSRTANALGQFLEHTENQFKEGKLITDSKGRVKIPKQIYKRIDGGDAYVRTTDLEYRIKNPEYDKGIYGILGRKKDNVAGIEAEIKKSGMETAIAPEEDPELAPVEEDAQAAEPKTDKAVEFEGFDSTKTYKKEEIKDLVENMLTNTSKYPDSPAKTQFIQNNVNTVNAVAKEMKQKKSVKPKLVNSGKGTTWDRTSKNGYEVSSKGDKRFSAFYAKLKNGKSIEKTYQELKGTGKGQKAKDPKFDYWGEYLGLWKQWAEANPGLIEELREKSKGKILVDRFASTDNNQARALAEILASTEPSKSKNEDLPDSTKSGDKKKKEEEKEPVTDDEVRAEARRAAMEDAVEPVTEVNSDADVRKEAKKAAQQDTGEDVKDDTETLQQRAKRMVQEDKKAETVKDTEDNNRINHYDDEIKGNDAKDSIEGILGNSSSLGMASDINTGQARDINEYVQEDKNNKSQLRTRSVHNTSDLLGAMANKAVKTLQKVLLPFNVKNKKYKQGDDLFRGLLYDSNGDINPNTAMAVYTTITEFLANNSSSLKVSTTGDLARMLGVAESELSYKQLKEFKDKGVLLKGIADKLGKNIIGNMGLKRNKDISIEEYAKLVSSAGNTAVVYMVEKGFIEFNDVPIQEYAKILGEEVDPKSEAKVPFIKVTGLLTPTVKAGMKTALGKIEEELGEVEKSIKTYHTKAVKDKVDEIRNNNGLAKVSDKAQKLMNKLRKTAFKPNREMLGWITENKEIVMKHMGFVSDEEMTKKGEDYASRESQEAKNEAIQESIDRLLAVDENVDEVFFDWFYSKNGRYFIDSNTLNPQTDLLHRFVITPSKHTVDIAKSNEKHMELFYYAIAQGTGFAVDKLGSKKIDKHAKKMIALGSEKLESLLHATKKEREAAGVEIEHIAHYVQVIQAVKAYEGAAPNGEFTTTLSAEFDALTSGFGIKVMQMPIIKNLMEWVRRIGVLPGDTDVDTMNDEIVKDDFFDSYQSLASQMDPSTITIDDEADPLGLWNELQTVMPQKGAMGEITSKLRTLFKDPFMTFNYAAGMASIKASLASNITEDIIRGIAIGDKAYDKVADKLQKTMKLKDRESLQNVLRTKDPRFIKIEGRQGLVDYLEKVIKETYGNQVENIMVDQFQEFIQANDTINMSFKLMFAAYNKEYQRKIGEMHQGTRTYGKIGDDVNLSLEDKKKIVMELQATFPLIKHPLSETTFEDGVAVYRSSTRSAEHTFGAAQTHLADGTSRKVQSMVKEFEAAISSGSVIPIHFIDGSFMAESMTDIDGVLLIHDAIMPSLLDAKKGIKDYNEAFYNASLKYNFVKEVMNTLDRVYALQDGETVSLETYIRGGYDPMIEEGDTYTITIDDMRSKLYDLYNAVEKGRVELHGRKMKIGHMVGLKGSMFETNGEEYKPEYKENLISFNPSLDTIQELDKHDLRVEGYLIKNYPEVKPAIDKIIERYKDC